MEKAIEKIFRQAKGTACEVMFFRTRNALTRIGDNEISQNVFSDNEYAEVRVQKDGKNFKFSLNRFDEESLKNAFANALLSLKYMKRETEFFPLIKTSVRINSERFHDKATAELSASFRAEKAKKITSYCSRKGMTAYGIISNGSSEIIIANTNGVYQRSLETALEYEVTVKCKAGYGAASAYSRNMELDFDAVNASAVKKAEMSKNPADIKPGKYTVILEPQPANELLSFMGYYGFSGQAYTEKRSFVSENLGKKMFPDFITVTDNALDGKAASMPFDFEGWPKEKVDLIYKGVVKNIVTDRSVSKKTGFRYTGHSLPQPNSYGPMAINVEMKEGSVSLEKMIENCGYGLLITQFHYTNCLKPKTIEMTGMTRNGTFLVKDGKISKAVKNLRFTQSAVEAFKNIESVGNKAELFGGYFGKSACPALTVRDFNFSSGTQF